jgi:hypothetical protein
MQVTKLGVCLIKIVDVAAFLVQVIIVAEVGSLMVISYYSIVGRSGKSFEVFCFPSLINHAIPPFPPYPTNWGRCPS